MGLNVVGLVVFISLDDLLHYIHALTNIVMCLYVLYVLFVNYNFFRNYVSPGLSFCPMICVRGAVWHYTRWAQHKWGKSSNSELSMPELALSRASEVIVGRYEHC